jgi:hypothetical protein
MAPVSSSSSPLFHALLRPLHLGVLGLGSAVSTVTLLSSAALGSALPAAGLIAVTGLAYVGMVGLELVFNGPAAPTPAPTPADDLDPQLAAIRAAAERLGPLIDQGGVPLIEVRLRVDGLCSEAEATVGRVRSLRALIAQLPVEALQQALRERERAESAARDPEARALLSAAVEAQKAQLTGRQRLVGLEERSRAALTLAESTLGALFARVSAQLHDPAGPQAEGLLAEVEGLEQELGAVQQIPAATLAEMGALHVQGR